MEMNNSFQVANSRPEKMEMEMNNSSPHQIKSIDNHHHNQDAEDTSKKGGVRTMPFVISNEAFEKVAGIGLQANMILYLKNEYNMSNATGATVLFLWSAISNFLPIPGAFLSDSLLGRFRVIALGTISSLLGMSLLWLTAILPEARPPECKTKTNCESPKSGQLALLFGSFVLMSIGAGGVRPCSLAFGADQFYNPNKPNNDRLMQTFFNWYYASVGVSIMLSITVIVYIQDKAGWVVGFGVPVGLMFLSSVMFLLGSPLYIKIMAQKSLFTSFAQVIAASWKNRHLALPPSHSDGWYYHKGSKLLIAPTQTLRFLNRACVIRNPEKDLDIDGWAIDPWSLCTVKEVEQLKALIKVVPIWSTGIVLATTISQHTFPLLQASTMDRHFFGTPLQIPPGSFGIFAMIALTLWVAVYDQIIVPLLAKFTKRSRGLTFKERMGIGLVISCASMAVAATVERRRRAQALRQGLAFKWYEPVDMSAMWLLPQHCLMGLAEAFNAIGQIEFYYSQFPKRMASIGVALFSLGMAVGNVVGSLIVTILNRVTKKHGKESWVSSNLNMGHYDYYYWLLTILSVINVLYFLVCAWGFGSTENKVEWDEAGEFGLEDESHHHVDENTIRGSPIAVAHAPYP